ncbi:MAG: hypothetical protein KKA10_13710, partial [Euryarchaeota archaeon]|nr:hypothetical protein [Euryarchaeota archaeon]
AAVTRTGSRNFQNSFNVVSKPENSFIPRLWAYTKIKKLMDQMDVEGETDPLVSSVTSISMEFKFVTPYTSLFVEVPRNATKTTTATGVEGEADLSVPQQVTGTPPAAYAVTATAAMTAAAAATVPPSASNAFREESKSDAPAGTYAEPGFELVFAMIGLFAVKYLVLRRRN